MTEKRLAYFEEVVTAISGIYCCFFLFIFPVGFLLKSLLKSLLLLVFQLY